MKKLLTILTISVLIGSSYADFGDGVDAYTKGDYEKAFSEWEPLAEQGFSEAQYNLGLMYINGQGVLKDNKKAFYWYKKSAEQGNARGQYGLGKMYGAITENLGTPIDMDKYVKLIIESAEQGFQLAQYDLAVIYLFGSNVLKDLKKAKYWAEKAYKGNSMKVKMETKELWDEFELWKY